jgi:5-methylcytosine-specific restriction endonuclease McrA
MGIPGKGTISKYGYREYINSPRWRAKREDYWASKMPKDCYVCGSPRKPGMHLHHRTYKNLGNERLMDLVPVCPACHDDIHHIHQEPRFKSKGLWYATKEARKRRAQKS